MNLTYSFSVDDSAADLIFPAPLDLAVSTRARWISDTLSLSPVCNWTAPTAFTVLNPDDEFETKFSGLLPGTDIQVNIENSC